MIKVKSFTTALKIFHSIEELKNLDEQVNAFVEKEGVTKIVSVSDTSTSDNTGATIGLIRVVAYEN